MDAFPVEVEVDISGGVPKLTTVGLAEGAAREAQERVKAAIKNSGYEFPNRKITINLAPADTRKGFEGYRTLAFSSDGKTIAGIPFYEKYTPKIVDILDAEVASISAIFLSAMPG